MKQLFQILLEFLQRIFHLNNKYRIKLIGMLCVIFGMFLYTLIFIINTKTLGNTEPLILDINNNTIFGKVIGSKMFKFGVHTLFGYWNLGPSFETLLGLIVLGFLILVILILLSSYIKIFMLPLTIFTSILFYNCFNTLKQNYSVDNTIEIFSKFGITLRKNPELIYDKLYNIGLTEKDLDESFNKLYNIFIKILEKQNRIYDGSKIDLVGLKEYIINKNIENKVDLDNLIISYIDTNIYIEPIQKTVGSINDITNIVPGSSTTIILGGLIIIGFCVFLYLYSGEILEYIHKVDNKVDSHITKTDAQGELGDKVADSLVEVVKDNNKLTKIVQDVVELQIEENDNTKNLIGGVRFTHANTENNHKLIGELKTNINNNYKEFLEKTNELNAKLGDTDSSTKALVDIIRNNEGVGLPMSYEELQQWALGELAISELFIKKIIEGIENHQNKLC